MPSSKTRLEELLEAGSAIAVVGMAAHVPGASGVREFWRNLREGVESIRPLDDERLRQAGVPDELLANPNYVKAGAHLEGMAHFDAGFFGLSPRDASIMDPQHRHFLECAWEAMEDAGHLPERFEGPIGVFAGSGTNAYFWANVMTNPELVREVGFFLLRHTGNDKDFLSTRVSYELDLTGPSVNVQTACSTSLVALHLATESLLTRECDMALAGGVTIDLPHGIGYLYRENEILSPDGHCRAFDAASAGTVFGSGAGIVVLRRLEDALADGDDIRAVVLGSAVNNDGSGKVGYLAPSVDGQARAIAEALTVSGVAPDEVDYVEAHGTGTAVGDPIEVAALTEAFRTGSRETGFCGIGSVKTNIGHLDTAAGVVGLIKVISGLQHREIPPSLHYRSPNPRIDFASSPFFVNATLRDWESGRGTRRAGVSSLGVGGTNAFVILEEAPEVEPSLRGRRALQLLPLSGRSRRVLEAASSNLSGQLEEDGRDLELADVAWTLSVGRRGFSHRRVVVAGSADEVVDALVSGDETRVFTGETMEGTPAISFLFAGGGAQYPGMGKGLHAVEPIYREVVDRGLAHLDDELGGRVRAFLLDPDALDEGMDLERPTLALPSLFITQMAQARLWMSWGVAPESMIGHSMGEYTAACLSGVLSIEDALDLVVVRARLFEQVPEGGMLSVNLPEADLRELLPEGLSVAAVNAPELSVASGPPELLQTLEERLSERELDFRRIHISVAAHSAMLDGVLDRFEEAVRGFEFGAPQIPFVSNLSGEWITDDEARDPEYWVRQLRHTVRFSEGVRQLMNDEPRLLLEVGPGRTLATLARMNRGEDDRGESLASMRSPDLEASDLAFQLGVLGQMWIHGAEIDWNLLYGGETRRRVSLPTYPFEREEHWIAPGRGVPLQDGTEMEGAGREAASSLDDPLADWFYRPAWTEEGLPDVSGDATAIAPLLVHGRGAAPEVAAALREAGVELVEIDSARELAPAFERLANEGRPPGGLIFLGLMAEEVQGSTTEQAFFQLFDVMKALGEVDPEPGFALLLAAQGMAQTGPEDRIEPWKALALGPMRVIPRELPTVRSTVVDLEPDTDPAAIATRLLAELQAEVGDPVVAWRNGRRRVERFESMPAGSTADAPARGTSGAPDPVRPGTTWVITGGLGGLGLTFARHLADRAALNLVLLGRSGLPEADQRDAWLAGHGPADRTSRRIHAVRELEAAGATVEVVAVDVGNAEACRAMVDGVVERFGSVDGVIHAAGVLDDAPILMKSRDEAAAVLNPKVAGTVNLDRALEGREPKYFIAFSSRSASTGLPGQVDYTAANAFLNAWARSARSAGRPGVFAIEWDVWREVGMAAELHAELTGQGSVSADAGSDPVPTPIEHPVFDARQEEDEDSVVYTSTFRAGRHWMLDEHRLEGGSALIPGTGFLELARAAFEQEGLRPPFALRDVMFLAPFMVEDDGSRELGVRIFRNGTGRGFKILGRPDPQAPWADHASGRAEEIDAESAPESSPKSLAKRFRNERTEVGGRPANPWLDFGPRWSNLVRLETGDQEALLTLRLPEAFVGDLADHALHPALLDVATGSAQSMVKEFGEEGEFYIPASYSDIVVRAPLTPSLLSHVKCRERMDGMAVFDISIMDTEGRELVGIEEFVMVRVDQEAALKVVHPTPEGPSDDRFEGTRSDGIEGIEDGIGPDDGILAFDRILQNASIFPPVVAVMRRDLFAVLGELEATGGAPTKRQPPPVDVSPLVDALLGHPAVRDATAVAHRYGPDDVRVVAFVVYDPGQPSTVSALRRHLRDLLSEDLVPRNFVEMTEIPRTGPGRVDPDALPDPFAERDEHVAPRTPTQETIAEIWKRLMGLSRVSIHDNFLDAGGHSLLGIRALLQIEKRTGVRLHPNQLTMQTLEQLAAEVDRQSETVDDGADQLEDPGLQSRMKSAFRQIVGR